MAVKVFRISYQMKIDNEPVTYTANICALGQEEAMHCLHSHVGKPYTVDSIGTECDVHEFSSTIRRNIAKSYNDNTKPHPGIVGEAEKIWTCPYTNKEFKTAPALKAHLTKLFKQKEDDASE